MRNCPSYPGYSATCNGKVFTHRKRYGKGQGHGGGVMITKKHCREMNPWLGHGGYMYVSISTSRGQRSMPVHIMLLDAFVGPRPDAEETRHLDGNPLNNLLSNLRYGARKENAADRVRHGRHRGREILNDAEVRSVRRLRQKGETFVAIAERHGISETCASNVANGRTYRHV